MTDIELGQPLPPMPGATVPADPRTVAAAIAATGYAFVAGHRVLPDGGGDASAFRASWRDLPPDPYAAHLDIHRHRRFGQVRFEPAAGRLVPRAAAAFVQRKEDNPLFGGTPRQFDPIDPAVLQSPVLAALMRFDFGCLPLTPAQAAATWTVNLHQISIRPRPGRPGNATPEGIHRDGHQFLVQHLIARQNITGAVSRIYAADRSPVGHVTMAARWDTLFLLDPRMLHAVTPVCHGGEPRESFRDMLLLDFNCQTEAQ